MMDLCVSPEQIFKEVSSSVAEFGQYVKNSDIPDLKVQIKWKKQPFGAWCTIRYFPTSYCRCQDSACHYGKYAVKEATIIVKNNFCMEAFKHFIIAEKQWLDNFVKEGLFKGSTMQDTEEDKDKEELFMGNTMHNTVEESV